MIMSAPMKGAIAHLKRSARVIASVGRFRRPEREPTFETLARSITFQQLNGKAAIKIWERLAAACGGKVTPQAVLRLPEQRMRAAGYSRQKLGYIRDLAAKTRSGE